MLITSLDVETTRDENDSPMPYNGQNRLVSAAFVTSDGRRDAYPLNHPEVITDPEHHKAIQKILDETDLLIGHNVKFDLIWLRECGFVYNGKVWDTQLYEYLASKSLVKMPSLAWSVERHKLNAKTDVLHEYFDKGYNTDQIPWPILKEYNLNDVDITMELYHAQLKEMQGDKLLGGLGPSLDLVNEFLPVLVDMERDGIAIDLTELDRVEEQFRRELDETEAKLYETASSLMGDTPINLNSQEHLSWILFSRKVNNKATWKETFGIGSEMRGGVRKPKRRAWMSDENFRHIIRTKCTRLERTEAIHCRDCDGHGKMVKALTKKGIPFKNPPKCQRCNGAGVNLMNTGVLAGLGLRPQNYKEASVHGFQTSKETIEYHLTTPISLEAKVFLTLLRRYSALSSYLSTFVGGIKKNVLGTILHSSFNQCSTVTGRLSSSEPNLQNFPREKTFPIRGVFTSRWVNEGGLVLDVDFSTLEFIVAGLVSGDQQIIEDVNNKIDVHTRSATIMTEAGQPTDRQGGKAHCVPMYSEILTREGWKTYDTVQVGEDVLAYDAERKLNVWTPLLEKFRYEDREVTRMETGQNWQVDSTPDHKWFCTKRTDGGNKGRYHRDMIVETQNIHTEHKIIVAAKSEGGALDITPKEAKLLGWLLGDGTFGVYGSSTNFAIIQKKANTIKEEFSEYVSSVYFRENGSIYHLRTSLMRTLFKRAGLNIERGDNDYEKFVLGLSTEARKSFLEAIILAEGTDRGYGVIRIAQNSGPLCEAIKLAAYLEGHDLRVTKVIMKYNGNQHEQITLRKKAQVTGQKIVKRELGVMDVWCPRTEYGSWIMKQGDNILISHNSFKPVYGGAYGTEAEMTYYKWFRDYYKGLVQYQNNLANFVVNNKYMVSPSGRVYGFPYCQRQKNGSVSQFQQICNYNVQGLATGDIVPALIIILSKLMKEANVKSKLVLTVHDSVSADIYPGERTKMIKLVKNAFELLPGALKDRWGIVSPMPLGYEVKVGKNLLAKTKEDLEAA